MAARKGLLAQVFQPCDGGVSPNAFVPAITVDVRVHFPPFTATEDEVRSAMTEAVAQMHQRIKDYFGEKA